MAELGWQRQRGGTLAVFRSSGVFPGVLGPPHLLGSTCWTGASQTQRQALLLKTMVPCIFFRTILRDTQQPPQLFCQFSSLCLTTPWWENGFLFCEDQAHLLLLWEKERLCTNNELDGLCHQQSKSALSKRLRGISAWDQRGRNSNHCYSQKLHGGKEAKRWVFWAPSMCWALHC